MGYMCYYSNRECDHCREDCESELRENDEREAEYLDNYYDSLRE